MIDVQLQFSVQDGRRRFDVDVAFSSQAPVTALFGPSGAGKSLTLMAMAGLVPVHSGRVSLGDRVVFDSLQRRDVPAPQRGVGYLFQHYALFPHLTVRQNIAFGLGTWWRKPAAEDLRWVDGLLHSFGLANMAGSQVATLSGGQQQRVALARALACRPHCLLLDEPFAALDPQLRQQMRDELLAVRARFDIPVVLITHDVDDVLALANVAFQMVGGRILRELDVDRGLCVDRPVSADAQVAGTLPMPAAARRQAHPHEARLRALLGAGH